MSYARLALGAVLACSISTAALAATKKVTLRDRQQAACANDAQKLCGDAMPDVDKVTACMAGKKAQVSAGCAKMYDVKD
jgi:hypothetical protein